MTTVFASLPCELRLNIFKFLSLDDKKSSRLVCRSWFQVLNDDFLTILNATLTDESLDHVKSISRSTLKSLTVENFTEPIILSYFRRNVLPGTNSLVLGHGNSNANLIKFLRYYCNSENNCIEKLRLNAFALADLVHSEVMIGRIFGSLPALGNWAILNELIIEVISYSTKDILDNHSAYHSHAKAICQLFSISSFPSLTCLAMHLDYGTIRFNSYAEEVILIHPFEDIFLQMFSFLTRHQQLYCKLKHLNITLLGNSVTSFRTTVISQGLNLIQLDTVKLKLNADEFGPYIFDLLSAQSSLKHFELHTNFWFVPISLAAFLQVTLIPKNCSTLQIIRLDGILHDFPWLPQCTELTSLTLALTNTNNLIRLPVSKPFHLITKFNLTSFFGSPNLTNPNGTRDEVMQWIVSAMPNLVELDLYFHCDFVFTNVYIMYLVRYLPALKLATLYRPEDEIALGLLAFQFGFKTRWVLREIGYPAFAFQMKITEMARQSIVWQD